MRALIFRENLSRELSRKGGGGERTVFVLFWKNSSYTRSFFGNSLIREPNEKIEQLVSRSNLKVVAEFNHSNCIILRTCKLLNASNVAMSIQSTATLLQ